MKVIETISAGKEIEAYGVASSRQEVHQRNTLHRTQTETVLDERLRIKQVQKHHEEQRHAFKVQRRFF